MPFERIQLHLDKVDIDRGGAPILADISFSAGPGEAIQFFGRNGCGKSTLLQALAGLLSIASGQLIWTCGAAQRPSTLPPEGSVSFVGHQAPFKAALSGRENIAFWSRTYNAAPDPGHETDTAIDRAGLRAVAQAPVAQYSAGQKRRLDLARVILANRPVWILDEPTAALDQSGAELWVKEISAHQASGGMVLIASHERLQLQSRNIHLG